MVLHLVSSLILVVIVIVYLIVYSQKLYQERFDEEDDQGIPAPSYCGDCNSRGRKGMNACLSCNNCGWCVDPNGYGSCVLGDYTGPYFADCAQYMFNGGISAFQGPRGPVGSRGAPNAPVGPANVPWYQMLFVPWYGGYGTGSINAAAPYIGNSFYNNNTPLHNARRWRPTGVVRNMI